MSLRRSFTLAFALAVAALAFGFASPAGAVDNPDYTAPVPSTTVPVSVVAETTPPAVQKTTAVPAANQRLAITGADSAQLAMFGVVLLAGGGITLAARRRITA